MHQTKKGNQSYFGIKVQAGVDNDSGLIHSVAVTVANVHDLTQAAELLNGGEDFVYGYVDGHGTAKKPLMAGMTTKFRVATRPGKRRALSDTPEGRLQNLIETANDYIHSKVEHRYRVSKQLFGFEKNSGARLGQEPLQDQCAGSPDELYLSWRQLLATG
jgi:IS5 family transposase